MICSACGRVVRGPIRGRSTPSAVPRTAAARFFVSSDSSPSATWTAAVWTWRDCWPFAWSVTCWRVRWIRQPAAPRRGARRPDRAAGRRRRRPPSPGVSVRRRSSAPVVALHGGLEAAGDDRRLRVAWQIGNQETEFVAAEACVQVARFARTLEREEVLRADLVGENLARRAR